MNKYIELLKETGAGIVNYENWGLRKLENLVKGKRTGYYCAIEFKTLTTVITKLETKFRKDEFVLRFISVILDKHAVKEALINQVLKK